jgi:hypothetical protein
MAMVPTSFFSPPLTALRLVHHRRARRLLLEVAGEAAALEHEAVDHAVEDGAVVVAVAHVLQEVLHRLRRLRGIELEADGAGGGAHVDLRVGGEARWATAAVPTGRELKSSL